MNVLVIEDDLHKLARLTRFIADERPNDTVSVARSVDSALAVLRVQLPDAIILDMSLPVFDYSPIEDGFSHLSYGGRDILEFLDSREAPTPVIMVTALDEFGRGDDVITRTDLVTELQREFPEIFLGGVWYSARIDSWQRPLAELIGRALETKHG